MTSVPFERGMGIGGWLTNYKRFNVLPDAWRFPITIGDKEHFQTYITEWDVENIASMGFDHIRVCFDQVVLEEAPGVYRDYIVTILRNFVDQCEKRGLAVVLNLHKSVGNYCDIYEEVTLLSSGALQDNFVSMWEYLEDVFSDKKDVWFELLNEVRGTEADAWNALASRTVKVLRAKNPTRGIVLGSACWNAPGQLKNLVTFDDDNILYTFHCYDPFEFTHQRGVLQPQNLYYNRVMPYPCEDIERYNDYHRLVAGEECHYGARKAMDKSYLAEVLQPAFDFAAEHPGRVWCGEFGTIRHAPRESRENYMRDMISLLTSHSIPYSVWNYLSTPNDGNRFSLVDDDTRTLLGNFGSILLGR